MKNYIAMEFHDSKSLADYKAFQEYPDSLLKFASFCCVVFIIIGVPGNLITIIALARYRKAHNATAILIMNLSFCDLLYCCFNLPLAAVTFQLGTWPFGLTMCRLFPSARFTLSCVALLSVMAITINRYVMIAYPRFYQMLYETRNLATMIIVLWVFAFGAILPSWFEIWGRFGMDPISGLCSMIPDHNGKSPATFYFITAFLLPCITIILCYSKIYQAVRKTMKRARSTPRIRQKDRTSISSTEPSTSTNRESENNLSVDVNVPELQDTNRTVSVLSCFRTSAINGTPPRDTRDTNAPLDQERRKISLRTKIFRKSGLKTRPTRKDKKLLTMITAVIVSFLICHLPLTILKVIYEIKPHPVPFILFTLLRYVTICINPLIYVVMSHEFRKAYRNVITFRPRCNLCNPWT